MNCEIDYKLTKRELEILKLAAFGLNNNEIAKKLFISKDTVKMHLSFVYRKMNAKNRIQAVICGIKSGIV